MARTDELSPSIPTIDISPFLANASPDAVANVVEAMRHACSTYGFFYLVGHGVSEEDRQSALACARLFFSLSKEEKMEVAISRCLGKSLRGYEPPGIQTHQAGLLPDIKEAYIIGAEVPVDDPEAGTFSTGPNMWPKALPDEQFRGPTMDYQSKMIELVKVLLRILSLGLPKEWGCPDDALCPLAYGRPSIPMRLIHYAPQEVLDERQFGVGDHTDFGGVAILLQEEGTEGLEVFYPPSQCWVPVPVKPDSYVINMGDMMQKWTGGYYRSARHRVITSSTKHRYSVPFFLNGDLGLNCRALDGSGIETTVGEHIRTRLMQTMGDNGKKLS